MQHEIRYLIRMEPGVQTPEETLELASGSCRDSGWLLVQMLRHLGLAARFVSGYLIQLKPDVKPLDGPRGPERGLHRSACLGRSLSARCGMDRPRSDLRACSPAKDTFRWPQRPSRIRLPPSPAWSAPARWSSTTRCASRASTKTRASPSPTPKSSGAASRSSAAASTPNSLAGDVRLTMGGEPTFVSIDDMDGDEWNTAALGPGKRRLAGDLLRRLRDKFAPGGLLHFGQGKWYPGESLPRWAFTCYWRTDGLPLWHDPQWIADPDRDYGFGVDAARRFAEQLARRLAVGPEYLVTAYEDPLAYIQKERELPVNVDPKDNKLDDPEERERLRRVFSNGVSASPSASCCRCSAVPEKAVRSGRAACGCCARRHLFLVPGDSPVGLRLPLQRCRGNRPKKSRKLGSIRSTAIAAAFRRTVCGNATEKQTSEHQTVPRPSGKRPVVRTALTVEPREGRFACFLPPVDVRRRLRRSAGRHRGHCGASRNAGADRRLSAARRPAPCVTSKSRPTPASSK